MEIDWTIDCSPNTRSKKKREIEEEQAGRLTWKHDEKLRRYVLQQSEDRHIEPPTPTQKPRPVASRLASSPSDPSSSSSGSSRPSTARPRKRACRQRASLPSTSSPFPSLPLVSTLPTPERNSERLDALLARFALGHADDDSSQMSPLRMMSSNITAPSPLRTTVSSTSVESSKGRSITAPLSTSSSRNLGRSASSISRDLGRSSSSSIFRDTSPTKSLKESITLQAPLSPIKPGAPRIGLRSSQSATSSSRRTEPNRLNKQFKPPLLASKPLVTPQSIRSSPRRHAPSSAAPPRHAVQTSVRGLPKLSQLEKNNEPSSDGPATGDESMDSFDGMIAGGGEDIEELLKAVDGRDRGLAGHP